MNKLLTEFLNWQNAVFDNLKSKKCNIFNEMSNKLQNILIYEKKLHIIIVKEEILL